jgi:hypothetical protein
VLGGTAGLWSISLEHDILVMELTMIARSLGIPEVNGEHYINIFDRSHDGAHMARSDRNIKLNIMMLEDIIRLTIVRCSIPPTLRKKKGAMNTWILAARKQGVSHSYYRKLWLLTSSTPSTYSPSSVCYAPTSAPPIG